jgi:hypothetical protein
MLAVLDVHPVVRPARRVFEGSGEYVSHRFAEKDRPQNLNVRIENLRLLPEPDYAEIVQLSKNGQKIRESDALCFTCVQERFALEHLSIPVGGGRGSSVRFGGAHRRRGFVCAA